MRGIRYFGEPTDVGRRAGLNQTNEAEPYRRQEYNDRDDALGGPAARIWNASKTYVLRRVVDVRLQSNFLRCGRHAEMISHGRALDHELTHQVNPLLDGRDLPYRIPSASGI
jgi:hypothetical protein